MLNDSENFQQTIDTIARKRTRISDWVNDGQVTHDFLSGFNAALACIDGLLPLVRERQKEIRDGGFEEVRAHRVYKVESDTEKGYFYYITSTLADLTCSCKGFQYHGKCKHVERLRQQQRVVSGLAGSAHVFNKNGRAR